MATIDEMLSNMTLFYSKSTGDIKSFCTGIQDMSYFGNDSADYSLIWDYVVLPKDDFVLNNTGQFKIDLVEKKLVVADNSSLSKYS